MVIALKFVIIKILFWKADNDSINKQIESINNKIDIVEVEDSSKVVIVNPIQSAPINTEEEVVDKNNDYFKFIEVPLINVDFNNLLEMNSDTVGWLQVPNTNINYPIVKKNDNEYYLNHSFDKSKNNAGWLFMDYRNTIDLNNKNLIIYGHNRKDKTMFGTLKLLLTNNWFNKESNKIIKMSMENGNSNWQIFSVYITPNTNDYIKTNFINDLEYQEFLDLISNRNQVDIDTSVTINDKILTLSTCHGSTKKLVVHAKLISNN